MPDATPEFFRDRWVRECQHFRRLARATDRPEEKRLLRDEARRAIRNAREWQGRVEGKREGKKSGNRRVR